MQLQEFQLFLQNDQDDQTARDDKVVSNFLREFIQDPLRDIQEPFFTIPEVFFVLVSFNLINYFHFIFLVY